MNSALAALYGNNITKTASEQDMDLTTDDISATQFLEAVAAGQIDINDYFQDESEKVASEDEIDFSQFSEEELAGLADGSLELDFGDMDKEASDQDAAYLEEAGRFMARAFHDEMSKVASEDEYPDEISLDDISASQAQELIESGEYEYVDDMDKEAMSRASVRAGLSMVGRDAQRAGRAAKFGFKHRGKVSRGAKAALRARKAAKGNKYSRGAVEALEGAARKGGKKLVRRRASQYAKAFRGQ